MHHILLMIALLFSFLAKAEIPQIQLANLYHDKIDVSQYLVSEKLDGVRGRFEDGKFISRQGNLINAPQWFSAGFPSQTLDGELWIYRNQFEEVSRIIRSVNASDTDWQKVRFMVFDLPKSKENFAQRYKILQQLAAQNQSPYLQIIEQKEISDVKDLKKLLHQTIKNGGEGLMLHRKDSFYKAERNDDLLKLKIYEDAEAIVIKHLLGQGKYHNQMGALLVETPQKIRFKIGSGFSDQQRQNPPKIGAKITYKFYGKTKNGVPRFAIFMRERDDEPSEIAP